jgi:hypothetical protein
MGKMEGGWDFGNPIDGFSDKNDDGDSYREIVTVRATLEKVCRDIKDYKMVATVNGAWCGFSVYRLRHPTLEESEGLNVPPGFRYWAPIGESDRTAFLMAVRREVEECIADATKEEAAALRTIAVQFADNAADSTCKVYRVSRSMVAESPRSVTYSGKAGMHRYVPPLSWFSQALQDIDPTELLTLLPPAEREAFVLLLGRLMAGASSTETAEGRLEHTWRSYAIMVGKPGVGKSTLLRWLKEALDRQGYTHAPVDTNFGRFGWGDVAAADLAFIDDLNLAGTEKLIGAQHIKTLVTGGELLVEDKGVKAVRVQAHCVVLALCNAYDYGHYVGKDGGELSRLNMLDTYSEPELKEIYGSDNDVRVYQHWVERSAALGVPPVVLMQRLLRHCLDAFLDVEGYRVESGTLERYRISEIEMAMGDLRDRYRIDTSLRHVEELVKAVGWFFAYLLVHGGLPARVVRDNIELIDFCPDIVLPYLDLLTSEMCLPDCFICPSMGRSCLPYIKAKLHDLERLKHTKSVAQAFEIVTGEIRSSNGFGYPRKIVTYQALWQQVRREFPYMEEQVRRHRLTEAQDRDLPRVMSSAASVLKHVGDLGIKR